MLLQAEERQKLLQEVESLKKAVQEAGLKAPASDSNCQNCKERELQVRCCDLACCYHEGIPPCPQLSGPIALASRTLV